MRKENNHQTINANPRLGKGFQTFVLGLKEFVELAVFVLLTIFLLTTFLCQHSIVVGPSMEKTLLNGEHLIISDLFYTPKSGDIIVFQDISKSEKAMVKRVIATGGQHVKVTSNAVYVEGEKLNETDYVYLDAERPQEYRECELTVPEGYLFVMGDHRNNSTDSTRFGVIDQRSVLGKVWFRISPFKFFK